MSTIYTNYSVTRKLLERLWADLWDRGIEELHLHGHTKESGLEVFWQMVEKSIDNGILCADGNPISTTGVYMEGDELVTFFQAAQNFNEHSWEITERLIQCIEKHADKPMFIYSVLIHPETERWFRILGFKRDEWSGVTAIGAPLFRFRRN